MGNLAGGGHKNFNRAKGVIGETIATNFLQKSGFKILERNYSPKSNFQGGEIDIIASRGEMIHFIEVKMRTSDKYGHGRESVTPFKQKNIRKIATKYLVERGIYETALCCFDVIEISGKAPNHSVEFLENCF